MPTKDKDMTKKDIQETFKKLGFGNEKQDNISEWMKKSNFEKLNEENVWIISDSTSSFVHFNQ